MKSAIVQNQINNLLRPRDYFVLDNLVELVFPQTDAEIEAVEDVEDEQEIAPQTEEKKPDIPPEKGRRGQFEYADDDLPEDVELMHYAGKKVSATGYSLGDSFVVRKQNSIFWRMHLKA